MNQCRIGQGFDVHAFTPGDHVVLGGVRIPHSHALLAHSDGDVLLHALCDALLGAAALGDIGKHFPDNDDRYGDISSRELLRKVVFLLADHCWVVANVDSIIIAEKPKMAPHTEQMRANIAADCQLSADAVNVKATTTEKLGFVGREEGIACQAVVLIERNSKETDMG